MERSRRFPALHSCSRWACPSVSRFAAAIGSTNSIGGAFSDRAVSVIVPGCLRVWWSLCPGGYNFRNLAIGVSLQCKMVFSCRSRSANDGMIPWRRPTPQGVPSPSEQPMSRNSRQSGVQPLSPKWGCTTPNSEMPAKMHANPSTISVGGRPRQGRTAEAAFSAQPVGHPLGWEADSPVNQARSTAVSGPTTASLIPAQRDASVDSYVVET